MGGVRPLRSRSPARFPCSFSTESFFPNRFLSRRCSARCCSPSDRVRGQTHDGDARSLDGAGLRRGTRDRRSDDDPHARHRARRRLGGHAHAAPRVAELRDLDGGDRAARRAMAALDDAPRRRDPAEFSAGDYGTYGSWVGAALHTEGTGFILRVAEANVRGFSILLDLFGVSGQHEPRSSRFRCSSRSASARRGSRARAPVSVARSRRICSSCLIWPGTPDRFLWPVWPLLLTARRVRRVGDRQMEQRGRADRASREVRCSPRLRCARCSFCGSTSACTARAAGRVRRARTRSSRSPHRRRRRSFRRGSSPASSTRLVSLYTGRPAFRCSR